MQEVANGAQRIFIHPFSFRPAEVRHQYRFGAVLAQIIDRRQTLANARVISDLDLSVALLDRDIEIHPHEDAFPAHFDLSHGKLGHSYFESSSSISTQRLL